MFIFHFIYLSIYIIIIMIIITILQSIALAITPRGVMVKTMDCRIVVCELVLQSRYYVHFRANTLGKGMNPFIHPAMG